MLYGTSEHDGHGRLPSLEALSSVPRDSLDQARISYFTCIWGGFTKEANLLIGPRSCRVRDRIPMGETFAMNSSFSRVHFRKYDLYIVNVMSRLPFHWPASSQRMPNGLPQKR